MKRIGALVCLMVMAISMMAPACFAAKDDAAESEVSTLKIESSTPEDGAKGVSVENLSVKLKFNKDMQPSSKAVRAANEKQFKLTDKKGKKIPIKVYYSEDEEGLMMVVSNVHKSNYKFEGNAKYTLTIGDKLQSADGTTLNDSKTIKFKTLDQAKSTMVYTIMMVVMIVGMIFFTTRSAKKAAEKEKETSGKTETVNPYKEAKRTGKSVEEIVEREKKKKAKQEAAAAKRKAADEELERSILEKLKKENNKRVSAPRPFSASGSDYKVKVVKTQPKTANKKSSTNPKNQTGKQKNSKNKNKGKKK